VNKSPDPDLLHPRILYEVRHQIVRYPFAYDIWNFLHTHKHTHTFNGLFSRTIWVSRHQKGKPFWILLKQEMMGGSGINWTICKPFAPHSRQITTPVPYHSIFYGPNTLPDRVARCPVFDWTVRFFGDLSGQKYDAKPDN